MVEAATETWGVLKPLQSLLISGKALFLLFYLPSVFSSLRARDEEAVRFALFHLGDHNLNGGSLIAWFILWDEISRTPNGVINLSDCKCRQLPEKTSLSPLFSGDR